MTDPGLCPRCDLPLAGAGAVERNAAGAWAHVRCPEPIPGLPAPAGEPTPVDLDDVVEAAATPPPADPPADPAGKVAAVSEALAAAEAAKATQDPPAPPPAAPRPSPAPRGRRQGPRHEEAKPWQPYNTDGTVNLGSYAAVATISTVELAATIILERSRAAAELTGTSIDEPHRGTVRYLAKMLLAAADEVQARLRADGKVDRMDGSHTRARGAIRDALDLYPVPFGAGPAERRAWWDALVDYAELLITLAVELIEPGACPPPELGQ